MIEPAEGIEARDRALERVLESAFAVAGPVALVGPDDRVAELAGWRTDLFVTTDAGSAAGVFALTADEATLRRAADVAREAGTGRVFVLAGALPPAGVLRSAGLALEGWDRILWQSPPEGPAAAVSRAERLEAETCEVLLRCVRRDDPEAVARLEEAVERLQRQLDVYAQLAVDHAATREVERVRAERLRELETQLQRLRGLDLAAEVERLRAELELIQATRLWRLGSRWWRLKARFQRGAG